MRAERLKKGLRDNLFTRRSVHPWNTLLKKLVEAGMIMIFKRHSDRYIDRKHLEEYGPGADKWNELG